MLLWHLHWVLVLLNSSTRSAKLQYSQREYWVEVALRVDENGTCTWRKWHLGWAKVALAHRKTTFLWFSRRTARAKRWHLPRFLSPEWVFRSRVLEQYLHCKLRGWRKVFYNKFDERWPPTEHAEDTEADCWENLPQMARIHHQGVQQSLLHQTTATPPTECTEHTEPSCRERTPTDSTDWHRWLGCAVLPQYSQNTQNWAAWVWQGCHTLLICEHPCSSVRGSSLPEGSVCAFCGNIFSPTDGTDEHRWLGCAVLPQNTQNTQNWAAWVWQGCHTLLHLWASVLICGRIFSARRFCAFCGNIFSPTDGTDLHSKFAEEYDAVA